jgi:hypothetical protein
VRPESFAVFFLGKGGGDGFLFKKKEYEIKYTKLGMKVNIYLESENRSQQITHLTLYLLTWRIF